MSEVPKSIQRIERFALRAVRKVAFPRGVPPKNLPTVSGPELNDYIRTSLLSEAPFMVARFGSIELSAGLYSYLSSLSLPARYKLYVQKRIDWLHPSAKYAESLIKPLCNNAGFFPENVDLLEKYSTLVREDIKALDCCCCCWGQENLWMKEYDKNVRFANLGDLEPYDYAHPWSKSLEGKKVLVVHPFAESIQKQYSRRDLLWENPDVLPSFDLKTLKAVLSLAGEEVPYQDWFEALDSMKQQMDETDYDIAIIGCGAYGFHLAAHAKRSGKKAVHLGGATQILFGIKGKRWDELPAVSRFYNEDWIYPSPEETPQNKGRVEGGCYW